MKAIPRYELTKEGQKALNAEVNRQLINHAEKHGCNNDAQVLLTLHLHYGFGKKRLRQFWEHYLETEKELMDYYRQTPITAEGEREKEFYAVYELRKIGVDVEHWRAVKNEWKPENDEIWKRYG